MANEAIWQAVHRFRFERLDSSAKEWDYDIQRFETEFVVIVIGY